jgi:imidazolonepropionase
MSSILIKNIKTLLQADPKGAPRTIARGSEMAHVPQINDAYLLIENHRIAAYGSMDDCPDRADKTIDAAGRMVLPAWCDSHTHIVYAAGREGEFVDRINGLTYEQIAERGGGILNSAQRLQQTSEDDLLQSAFARLQEVVAMGTGAIEIKSGYGLSVDAEIKMLRVIRRLRGMTDATVKATFLGAHAVPTEYKNNRAAYIKLITDEMLPRIAKENLAEYCDVFCDKGFYTVEETDLILKAALKFGLKPKIHANELDVSGGVQVGVANGAISVDHLERITRTEIDCLLQSNTMPTALPGTSFFLRIPYAPARDMIDAGLPVCLATDYNPGSTPSGNMPFVWSLGCIQMRLTPEEALNAITLNGAHAMEIADTHGSISVGKLANIIVTKPVSSLAFLPYSYGSNWVETVILRGEVQ